MTNLQTANFLTILLFLHLKKTIFEYFIRLLFSFFLDLEFLLLILLHQKIFLDQVRAHRDTEKMLENNLIFFRGFTSGKVSATTITTICLEIKRVKLRSIFMLRIIVCPIFISIVSLEIIWKGFSCFKGFFKSLAQNYNLIIIWKML